MIRSIIFAAVAVAAVLANAQEPRHAASRLLIVDGQNNHDWPRATMILREILEGSGLFAVDVSTSPSANATKETWDKWRPQFAKYRVVLSNYNGCSWPREVEKALEDYVSNGGGLVVFHAANNPFPNWPAYNQMIGLAWRDKSFGPSLIVSADEKIIEIPKGRGRNPGHGPEHDFQVTILNADHPITNGMPKKWMHPHEQLTHGQHGPANKMTVLTYAWSKDTKENEPMDWVVPYGKGRVYTTLLGHLWKDGPDTAMRCVGFQTLLVRGCEWAATGKVTYPVPKDFPTPSEIRLAKPQPAFGITVKKSQDQCEVETKEGITIFTVRSPSGIGGATMTFKDGKWPTVVLRLHLNGLEFLTDSNGKTTLSASVLSHSGNPRLLNVVENGKEKKVEKGSPYWTEIRGFDSTGKPVPGLPGSGGYFEVKLPKVLLDGQPKSLELEWIDFNRG